MYSWAISSFLFLNAAHAVGISEYVHNHDIQGVYLFGNSVETRIGLLGIDDETKYFDFTRRDFGPQKGRELTEYQSDSLGERYSSAKFAVTSVDGLKFCVKSDLVKTTIGRERVCVGEDWIQHLSRKHSGKHVGTFCRLVAINPDTLELFGVCSQKMNLNRNEILGIEYRSSDIESLGKLADGFYEPAQDGDVDEFRQSAFVKIYEENRDAFYYYLHSYRSGYDWARWMLSK